MQLPSIAKRVTIARPYVPSSTEFERSLMTLAVVALLVKSETITTLAELSRLVEEPFQLC